MPGEDEDPRPVPDIDGIEITTASPQYLLAMKLMAMRFGQDDEDIEVPIDECGLRSAQEALNLLERLYPSREPCRRHDSSWKSFSRGIRLSDMREQLMHSHITMSPPQSSSVSGRPIHLSACLWGFLACGLLAALLTGPLSPPAQAEPTWTTYHRDAQRTGDDPDATQPVAPALAWQTTSLGAPIWSQPLVLGERAYVATVGDEVYALEASTGKVIWDKSLGTPVPSEDLPCGDVEPTVGVVGTPVIDQSTQTIYMVADTVNAKDEVKHLLKGLSLDDGTEMVSRDVDPPGADPKALLQRTALNLDEGNVIFGYGGNDGDCSDYQGVVVATPENGGPPRFWQYQPEPPSSSGGAVWATAGPSVDGGGNVYATTGNPDPPAGQKAEIFDYSDSVVKLDLTHDFVQSPASEFASPMGWFEPPNWEEESNNDLDLSSAAAELLPGGLLFQAGKDGVGYLIDASTMHEGAAALYSHAVCQEHSGFSGSFGGDSFAAGALYIPCENGVQALAYSEADKTFTPLWQGPSDAVGPPIVSAGLVWTIATGRFSGGGTTLYGLDPATGIPRYTETLPSPVIDHFASPSAAGGRLFVATGCSVTAYQVSQLPPSPARGGDSAVLCPAAGSEGPDEPPVDEPTKETSDNLGKSVASEQALVNPLTLTMTPAADPVRLVHTNLRAGLSGRVHVALRCTTATPCNGVIDLQVNLILSTGGQHKGKRTVPIQLARARFGPVAGNFGVTLRLGRGSVARLHRHHDLMAVQLTISAQGYPAKRVSAVLR
jgi:outer membrane protein assembly factor BamB